MRSCHDLSEGGLAVALAEMCVSGDVGLEGDVGEMGNMRSEVKLFSESNSRWLVEVDEKREGEWREAVGGAILVGEVGGNHLVLSDGAELMNIELTELRKAWSEPFWRLLV